MQSNGRKIHARAVQALESGEPLGALKLTDEAMVEYAKANDRLGFAEIQAVRTLAMRHLWQDSGQKFWLIAAKHESMVAVEVAEEAGDETALAIPYFNLAKVKEELGELDAAIADYVRAEKLITECPPKNHDRDGVRADFRIHLAACELKNGDKTAEERVLAGIKELEASDEKTVAKYNFDVWLSGAYMSLADAVEGSARSREYLSKAKAIIDANPELVVRAKQWEKLAEKLNG